MSASISELSVRSDKRPGRLVEPASSFKTVFDAGKATNTNERPVKLTLEPLSELAITVSLESEPEETVPIPISNLASFSIT